VCLADCVWIDLTCRSAGDLLQSGRCVFGKSKLLAERIVCSVDAISLERDGK